MLFVLLVVSSLLAAGLGFSLLQKRAEAREQKLTLLR